MRQLKPGFRVVSHDFRMEHCKPDRGRAIDGLVGLFANNLSLAHQRSEQALNMEQRGGNRHSKFKVHGSSANRVSYFFPT